MALGLSVGTASLPVGYILQLLQRKGNKKKERKPASAFPSLMPSVCYWTASPISPDYWPCWLMDLGVQQHMKDTRLVKSGIDNDLSSDHSDVQLCHECTHASVQLGAHAVHRNHHSHGISMAARAE